jgi:hypothetical protein
MAYDLGRRSGPGRHLDTVPLNSNSRRHAGDLMYGWHLRQKSGVAHACTWR